jgi:hypothetical protein
MNSVFEQRIALFDYALKSQFLEARRMVDTFAAGLAGPRAN